MENEELVRRVMELENEMERLKVKIAGDKALAAGESPWALIPSGYFNLVRDGKPKS